MFQVNTVKSALAPLLKVQANLKAVAKKRRDAAVLKRNTANALVTGAEVDETEQKQAEAILEKLTALLTPTEG